MDREKTAWGARALAALLIVGGGVGIGLAIYTGYEFAQVHWIYLVLVAAFMAVFVWSAITGVRLWRGQKRGWKWATILYGAQIPVLTVPGFSYEYYAGLAVKVMGGNVDNAISLGLGASADLFLDTRITDLAYGVNLFAIGAVIYLLRKRPNKGMQPTAQSAAADA